MNRETEERWVAQWLRQAAAETAPRPLPSASQIWWKARIIRQLVERDSQAEKAVRPVLWSQGIGLGLLILVAALLLTVLGGSLLGGLDSASLASGSSPWRWVSGFLLFGTVLPILGLGALWVLWRDA